MDHPQKVDLFQPIVAARKGPAPLVIRVGVQAADFYSAEGAVGQPIRPEAYVLLSALPTDLRRSVETAIQALIAGM